MTNLKIYAILKSHNQILTEFLDKYVAGMECDEMLYLVYDYSEEKMYKMELNEKQYKFIRTSIFNLLYIYKEIEVINPEDKIDKNDLYFAQNVLIGSYLIYLNKETNRLLRKLGFKTQKYDFIEEIDFYDWCLINKKEVEIYLDAYEEVEEAELWT